MRLLPLIANQTLERQAGTVVTQADKTQAFNGDVKFWNQKCSLVRLERPDALWVPT